MILTLRIFFSVVFASMVVVTSWAGSQVALWAIPAPVGGHPWFIATLFDAYWGFLTFYLWQFYKEPSWSARGLWLIADLLLGNMAMAAYGLAVSFSVPRDADAAQVLLRSKPLPGWLPLALVLLFGVIAMIAARA